MSGGVAYIYDKDDRLKRLVNEDLAGDLFRVDSPQVGGVMRTRMSARSPVPHLACGLTATALSGSFVG